MRETILAPRQGLYPLFKRSSFDRGMHIKLNAGSNKGKRAPLATRQGGVHEQNAVIRGKRREQRDRRNCMLQATQQGGVHEHNATSNATEMLPAMRQGDAQTHSNQKKNTAVCANNETQWFYSWEVVLVLAGILVCGGWEVLLVEWLSPVVRSASSYIGT
jgi:hypothetical protein